MDARLHFCSAIFYWNKSFFSLYTSYIHVGQRPWSPWRLTPFKWHKIVKLVQNLLLPQLLCSWSADPGTWSVEQLHPHLSKWSANLRFCPPHTHTWCRWNWRMSKVWVCFNWHNNYNIKKKHNFFLISSSPTWLICKWNTDGSLTPSLLGRPDCI